jgi:hypothetical protein
MQTIRDIFTVFPFLTRVRFYLALLTVLVAFGPRFGATLNTDEIAALQVLILVAFGMETDVRQSAQNVQAYFIYRAQTKAQARAALQTLKEKGGSV